MNPSLWFVVPAHGRVDLTRICLQQLRRTCDALAGFGVVASAVVVADDENLDSAADLGFWGYEQDNAFLGRKFNDGYELAAREGVDYVVPLGSDDWIHHRLLVGAELPRPNEIRCARRLVMVAEGGEKFMRLQVNYEGGIGMRITPTSLLKPLDYRPADEDRPRGVDTNTLMRIKLANRVQLTYFDADDFQIVDFKTEGANLNTWEMCVRHGAEPEEDPWLQLAASYPAESVSAMRRFYEAARSAAPAA